MDGLAPQSRNVSSAAVPVTESDLQPEAGEPAKSAHFQLSVRRETNPLENMFYMMPPGGLLSAVWLSLQEDPCLLGQSSVS